MPTRRPPLHRPRTTRPASRPATCAAPPRDRSRARSLAGGALLLAVAGSLLAGGAGRAAGHGSMQNPLSRLEGCYLEGPEHPVSAACRAMVAVAGPAPLYDWMSLRIGDAGGRSRELIPDGRLCSAGQDAYRGLDLPRADWPASNLTSGAAFTFRFRATAPHKGTFQLFLTNPGYDPTKPLRWADLDAQPFLTATDPQLTDGSYLMPGTVPAGRHGRQLIYAIWQRSDSPEAFYSCSDVVFDGTGGAPTAVPASAVPTMAMPMPMPTSQPATPAAAATPTPTHSAPASPTPTPARTTTPTATAPAATTPVSATARSTPLATTELASTGPDRSPGLLAAVGGAFLLAGATVTVLHHRRRRPGTRTR
ncbi:hypothetical protein GCM10009665_45710 [Kitasatospora nipponensis]|uniref:Chitin-binding type-4 domain-containing protein n=1 Tax=Kitasatospora nipponensis TaxID=258049 RepID=A0ABN1WH65_9ACTN